MVIGVSVKFTSHANEVLSQLQLKKNQALEIIGGKAESYAKRKCPTKTGNLKNSITHRQEDENTEVIGTKVKYAPYVELGHHQEPGRYVPAIKKRLVRDFVPPKAFLRPAVEDHVPEYKRIAEQILKN